MSAATFFMLLFFCLVLWAAWRTFKEDPPEPMPRGAANKQAMHKPLANIAADKPAPGPVGINAGATISEKIEQVMELDRDFAPQDLLERAKDSFTKILAAFENGKLAEVEELMSAKIHSHLQHTHKSAVKAGRFPKTEIIRFKRISITETRLKDRFADMDILFETEQVALIVNKDGKTIEGDENQILFVRDLWTFSRDLKSKGEWVLSGMKTAEEKK